MNDTICAISTALGVGAISIIRISGNDTINIVNKIFSKDLTKVKTHTINYGFIVDKKEKIDEVLLNVMLAPKTYTTEDTIEINCHGGISTTNKILELLLTNGARLASPGEFTKRAFINGRIDLLEAESVMDLIDSKTDNSRKLALNSLNGSLSRIIREIREKLVGLLSNIEVNIDYPEYDDIEIITKNDILKESNYIKESLNKLLRESENGKLIKEGINTLILGRPNVGKSSILNKLIEEEKAIVTDIAGTTRDIVEGNIRINGVLLNLIDTAGIRNTNDIVEKIGVEKSINLIDKSDLIILVFNNNENLTVDDIKLLEKTNNKKRIIVINKNDLSSNIEYNLLPKDVLRISSFNNKDIELLKEKISYLFNLEELNNKDFTYLSNARQISIVKKAVELSNILKEDLEKDVPIDMLEINIKEIWNLLGELIGDSYEEELIDNMFERFCLGK